MTSLALADGNAIIAAAGDDGSLRWWDAPTGRLISGPALNAAAPVLSLAPVLMPALPRATGEVATRLAGLRDGRTVLAAGDTAGVVSVRDPATRMPVTALFQRPGRRVVSMTAVNLVNHPPWRGTNLVAVYDDLLVDVWESGSVHSNLSTMAPGTDRLAAAGHWHITGAAVSPSRLGYRQPVMLADRNGTVSMWETFGTRLSDSLPPDPAHREVTGITVLLYASGDDRRGVCSSTDQRLWRSARCPQELRVVSGHRLALRWIGARGLPRRRWRRVFGA